MFEGLGIKPVTRLCRPSIKWCPLWWRCLRMSPHLRRGPRRSSGRWTPTEMVCLIFVHHLLESFSFVTVCTYTFRLYTVALRSTWTTRQQLNAWRTARDQSVAWVRGGQDSSKKREEMRQQEKGEGERVCPPVSEQRCVLSFISSIKNDYWQTHWEAAQVCLFQQLRGPSQLNTAPCELRKKGTRRIYCWRDSWYLAVKSLLSPVLLVSSRQVVSRNTLNESCLLLFYFFLR